MANLAVLRACAVILLVAVAGCRTVDVSDPCHSTRPAISVVTLNLYHDRDDWPRRRSLIVDGLRRAQPDLIALQEVLQAPGLRNQAQDLAETLGYHYLFVSLDAPDLPRRYGNAILSRHPFVRHDQVALRPLDDHRSAARVRVRVHGRTLDFIATHLHAGARGGHVRAQQVRHLLEFIAAGDGQSTGTLVAGDFNATAASDELKPMRSGFEDAYARLHPGADLEPATHATLNPAYFEGPTRIDHVYAQRGPFEPCMARRILDAPGVAGTWPSDHFGVLVRLGFGDSGVESAERDP